jgi:hypothetical protein
VNRIQKRVIALGFTAAVLLGLFPPFEGRESKAGDDVTFDLGRRFLLAPPSQHDAFVARIRLSNPDYVPTRKASFTAVSRFSVNLKVSSAILQIVVALTATGGGFLFFAGDGKDSDGILRILNGAAVGVVVILCLGAVSEQFADARRRAEQAEKKAAEAKRLAEEEKANLFKNIQLRVDPVPLRVDPVPVPGPVRRDLGNLVQLPLSAWPPADTEPQWKWFDSMTYQEQDEAWAHAAKSLGKPVDKLSLSEVYRLYNPNAP